MQVVHLESLESLLTTSEAKSCLLELHLDANTGPKVKATDTAQLLANLQKAQDGVETLDALREIAIVLYATYRVHQGNTERNSILNNGLISKLLDVVHECLVQVQYAVCACPELLIYKEKLARIFELPFAICEFYSVNDKIDDIQEWQGNAEYFRLIAELSGTIVDAKFREFRGSEISRRLPHGSLDEAVRFFQESIGIYRKNGVTLNSENKYLLQHTLNGYSIAISKQLFPLIEEASEIDDFVYANICERYSACRRILDEMEPCLLKPGVNIGALHTNNYQNLNVDLHVEMKKPEGNLLATKALILLLTGKINDDLEKIHIASLQCMPLAVTPQYANLENRYANFCITYAALAYLNAIQKGDKSAQIKLDAIAEHQFVKIAKKLFACNKLDFSAINLEKAESLMVTAVELYEKSYTRTKVKNEGLSYGKQASKFLLNISGHPACVANKDAMEIVNELKSVPMSASVTVPMKTQQTEWSLRSYINCKNATRLAIMAGFAAAVTTKILGQQLDNTNSPKFTL